MISRCLVMLIVSARVAMAQVAQPLRVPAQAILAVADDLQLDASQLEKLHALETKQQTALSKATAAYLRAEADLLDAARGDDLTVRRLALEKRSKIAIDAEIARLQGEKDAKALLQPDQRTAFAGLAQRVPGSGLSEVMAWQALVALPPRSRLDYVAPTDFGVVRMKVSPNFADIFVDSVKVGTGFKQLSLPVGAHIVRFQAPGCGSPIEQAFRIEKDQLVILPPVTISGCVH